MKTTKKQSKYHNRKVIYNGMVFDSEKERDRFIELSLLERAGKIQNLKRQVDYLLIPAQFGMVIDESGKRKRVCLEKSCSYVADFTYNIGEEFIVEDVKGCKRGAAYDLFTIKRKLMLQNFGIRIKEV